MPDFDERCILVIDDETGVREVISESLKVCGYQVMQAENGMVALAMIGQGRKPDVVITDLIMPGQDGMEIILTIRQKFPDVRLVAISGGGWRNSADFLTMAEDLGADVALPKPLDMDELERVVGELATGNDAGSARF